MFRITLQLAAIISARIVCFFGQLCNKTRVTSHYTTGNLAKSRVFRTMSHYRSSAKATVSAMKISLPRRGAHYIMIRFFKVLLIVSSLIAVTACSGSRGVLSPDRRPPEITTAAVPEYRLGAGDVVSVNVWKTLISQSPSQ